MPVEATPTNNARVIISHTEGEVEKRKAGRDKWIPLSLFVGLSGLVLAAQLIDLLQGVIGTPYSVLKILVPLLGGAAGFFAASHLSLFRQGKPK